MLFPARSSKEPTSPPPTKKKTKQSFPQKRKNTKSRVLLRLWVSFLSQEAKKKSRKNRKVFTIRVRAAATSQPFFVSFRATSFPFLIGRGEALVASVSKCAFQSKTKTKKKASFIEDRIVVDEVCRQGRNVVMDPEGNHHVGTSLTHTRRTTTPHIWMKPWRRQQS